MGTIIGHGQALNKEIMTPRVEEMAQGTVMPITMMGMVAVEEMAQTTPATKQIAMKAVKTAETAARRLVVQRETTMNITLVTSYCPNGIENYKKKFQIYFTCCRGAHD